jgi:hypothetical protein
MTLLPYIGSVINLGNSFSHATRPKNVGKMSELIQKFRDSNYEQTVDGWKQFYDDQIGSHKIEEASEKIWEYVERIKENLTVLTKEDVYEWTRDLIIDKTFSGLQIQLEVLKIAAAGRPYKLSSNEEESKGIDGYIDSEPVSIKPHTYKTTLQSTKENIEYRIIYYKITKNGILIL